MAIWNPCVVGTAAVTGSAMIESISRGVLTYRWWILVGTLVQVGRGKLPPSDCGRILHSRERSQAGPTAPPQGLFLMRVCYDPIG